MQRELKRLIVPILVLTMALPSFAQAGKSKMQRGNMLDELNLTQEQETQMKELRYSHEKNMIDLEAKLKRVQLDLKKLERADEPNKKKIHAQIEKVGSARVAVQKARADQQLEIRKVLTEEQYKIFRKNMRGKGARDGKMDAKPGKPGKPGRGFRK